MGIRKIKLTQGKWATVSEEDYAYLSQFNWKASYHSRSKRGHVPKWYCRRFEGTGTNRITIYMHREIMKCPHGFVVDHNPDPDGLNNTRENLTIKTGEQNTRHCRFKKKVDAKPYL